MYILRWKKKSAKFEKFLVFAGSERRKRERRGLWMIDFVTWITWSNKIRKKKESKVYQKYILPPPPLLTASPSSSFTEQSSPKRFMYFCWFKCYKNEHCCCFVMCMYVYWGEERERGFQKNWKRESEGGDTWKKYTLEPEWVSTFPVLLKMNANTRIPRWITVRK